MDGERFDRIVRELAVGASRRQIFAAGAALAALLSEPVTNARGKRRPRRCKSKTCAGLGRQCGNQLKDNCNRPIDCGACPNNGVCDLATGRCSECQSKSCGELGLQCGNQLNDNCGKPIDCGACPNGGACDLATGHCQPGSLPPNGQPCSRENGCPPEKRWCNLATGLCLPGGPAAGLPCSAILTSIQACRDVGIDCGLHFTGTGCSEQFNCGSCPGGATCQMPAGRCESSAGELPPNGQPCSAQNKCPFDKLWCINGRCFPGGPTAGLPCNAVITSAQACRNVGLACGVHFTGPGCAEQFNCGECAGCAEGICNKSCRDQFCGPGKQFQCGPHDVACGRVDCGPCAGGARCDVATGKCDAPPPPAFAAGSKRANRRGNRRQAPQHHIRD